MKAKLPWERCLKGPLKLLHEKTTVEVWKKLSSHREREKLNELSGGLWRKLSRGKTEKEKDFILKVMYETILIVMNAIDEPKGRKV